MSYSARIVLIQRHFYCLTRVKARSMTALSRHCILLEDDCVSLISLTLTVLLVLWALVLIIGLLRVQFSQKSRVSVRIFTVTT